MGELHALPLSTLLALAPELLPIARTTRYLGGSLSVTLDMFTADERRAIRDLYTNLQKLLDLLKSALDAPRPWAREVHAFHQRSGWRDVLYRVQHFGPLDPVRARSEVFLKVLHDLRGGGLQALIIQLQLLGMQMAENDDLLRMFFLARDHLKIMRNAVPDLDPAGYERDRSDQLHNVDLLTEKWRNAKHLLHGKQALVEVDCQFRGNVAERCLEFAALDRVLYNLLNNATQHTADGTVRLVILPLSKEQPHDLRFVVYNAITDEQRLLLQGRYGDTLDALFQGGFTTGGAGLGLRICADFVGNAYGVTAVGDVLRGGYIGARIIDQFFVSWFHWPVAAD